MNTTTNKKTELSEAKKKLLIKAVKKTVKQYDVTLKLLAKT